MGSDSEKIPCLQFSGDFKEGSEEWKKMSKKVREVCERHGCFMLINDMVLPKGLRDDMIVCMKELFDLPEETKRKHVSPKPYRSYNCDCSLVTMCQSFGIDDAPFSPSVHAFSNLIETLKSTSSKMQELSFMILKMILEGYCLPKQYTWDIEEMNSSCNLRLIKYRVPESGQVCENALLPHTDKSALTILCENEVQGLQVLTKTNKWIPIKIPHQGFVVLVGDILQAWSNRSIHAATHRVMMKGEKERYSFALFSVPKEEAKIEVPHELVEDKMHPLRYKPFNYGDYFNYYVSTLKENALDLFAGV
ncbi:hypothetical protein Fmac_032192 [Flemingia macrophylla]|uniref:2-oxoglutarate-dependent dioxygenase DAO n=1 Tax=Flemingia macrophylla TaxID=520843 RepID=A0ABD1L495_9FABA